MKIVEIKNLAEKMPVMDLTAKLEKVFPPVVAAGYNQSVVIRQNVVLSDDTGNIYAQVEIPANIVNKKTDMDWNNYSNLFYEANIGKPVKISCQASKNGLVGARAHSYNDKTGKIIHQIKITKMAVIDFIDNDTALPPEEVPAEQEKIITPAQNKTHDATQNMWLEKERREHRKKIADTVFMTIYPLCYNFLNKDLKKEHTPPEKILEIVEIYTNGICDIVYEKISTEDTPAMEEVIDDETGGEEIPF